MSNLTVAASLVLVKALVVVEHDREKHIPGVTDGPQAETFLVPVDVADSLERAGAVERAEVVDTSVLLNDPAATAVAGSAASGMAGSPVNAVSQADVDQLLAALADATQARDSLAEQLLLVQRERDDLAERLAASSLVASDGAAAVNDASTGTTVVDGQVAGDVPAADATQAAADAAVDPAAAADTKAAATTTRKR